jgi:hypothetical protein
MKSPPKTTNLPRGVVGRTVQFLHGRIARPLW